jgi:hypothetical protein
MRIPRVMISDKCLEKLEQKHHIQLEDAVQGVTNAKEWRKVQGRYEAESSTDSGRRIFVVVERCGDEWQIVTAWWL